MNHRRRAASELSWAETRRVSNSTWRRIRSETGINSQNASRTSCGYSQLRSARAEVGCRRTFRWKAQASSAMLKVTNIFRRTHQLPNVARIRLIQVAFADVGRIEIQPAQIRSSSRILPISVVRVRVRKNASRSGNGFPRRRVTADAWCEVFPREIVRTQALGDVLYQLAGL